MFYTAGCHFLRSAAPPRPSSSRPSSDHGYSAKIPCFASFAPAPKPVYVEMKVTGKERIAAGPGKTVEAWKVHAESPATQEIMEHWLVKEPPYVIRLMQEWQGRMWTFEMTG